ncbi:hypothetical protein Goshw_002888 [Gossypium schwendimanii]|uniref:Uncharacterized protein n=1 Tax=Gossypium schwendimanii TaxID=34291 RepID=A0A7J9N0U5_GOSSC|nr:hypothetical protein [Gossypium schwendimanii]
MRPRCTGEVENTKYVFRDCSVTKEIWQKLDFVRPPLDREKLPSRGQEIERWRLLEGSNLKINFDVPFNKQENTSCSRIVIRNSNGGVLGSKTVLICGGSSRMCSGGSNAFGNISINGGG